MALTFSTSLFLTGTTFNAIVEGVPAGSTLTLTTNPDGRWSLAGRVLACSNPQAGDVPVITETLAAGGSTAYPLPISTRNAPSTLRVSGAPLPAGVGSSSEFVPIITGGTPPYYIQVIGRLPAGRSIDGLAVVGTYLSSGPNIYALQIGDAAGASVRLTVSENVGVGSPAQVVVILANGNSHGGGRAVALGNEFRDPRILQWKQDNTLEQLSATTRYTFDQQVGGSFNPATQISPMLWFANTLLAGGELGPNDRVLVVPNNKNATAFADGTWTAGGAPANSLGVNVTRANAAMAAMRAQGYLIKEIVLAHHSANPDYDDGANWDQRRADYDANIAYCRANLTPADISAVIPAIFGCGMTALELATETAVNRVYQSGYAATNIRNTKTAVMDHVNPRYGYSTGVPVGTMPDGIHEDYAGLITMGTIYYDALIRARAAVDPRAAFNALPFAANAYRFWDFRSGGGMHYGAGAPGSLSRVNNTLPPNFEFDAALSEYALYRGAAGITSTSRPFLSNAALPVSYTKWLWIKPESIAAAMGFIGDTDAATAAQHRFFYSQSANELRGGHGATQNNVAIPGAATLFTVGTYHLVTLAYDAAALTMTLTIDGTTATGAAVPAHAATRTGFIGAANSAGGLSLVGSIGMGGVFDKALSDAEVAQLRTACQATLYG